MSGAIFISGAKLDKYHTVHIGTFSTPKRTTFQWRDGWSLGSGRRFVRDWLWLRNSRLFIPIEHDHAWNLYLIQCFNFRTITKSFLCSKHNWHKFGRRMYEFTETTSNFWNIRTNILCPSMSYRPMWKHPSHICGFTLFKNADSHLYLHSHVGHSRWNISLRNTIFGYYYVSRLLDIWFLNVQDLLYHYFYQSGK